MRSAASYGFILLSTLSSEQRQEGTCEKHQGEPYKEGKEDTPVKIGK